MAYTPTAWQDYISGVQDGTPVNAVSMNKIEDGLLRVHQVADSTASALDRAYHPLAPYYSAGATTSDSTIYFATEGLTPGVYLMLASGNHNPRGAAYYRSVHSAILLLSCGYNSTTKQIVYRIKIGSSSSAVGVSGVADSNFAVGFEGMAAETPRASATAKIFIRLSRDSAASTADNWDVRLHKLI